MYEKGIIFLLLLFFTVDVLGVVADCTLTEWIAAIDQLPTNYIEFNDGIVQNRNISYQSGFAPGDKYQSREIFKKALDQCINTMVEDLNYGNWLGEPEVIVPDDCKVKGAVDDDMKAVFSVIKNDFRPFAQVLQLYEGDRVIFHGDFHGDCRSFAHELQSLKRKK